MFVEQNIIKFLCEKRGKEGKRRVKKRGKEREASGSLDRGITDFFVPALDHSHKLDSTFPT